MSKLRFATLALGFLVAGGACYVLVGRERLEEAGVVVWMFLMVVWFIHKDWEVDSY